jgi:hypothetical protein
MKRTPPAQRILEDPPAQRILEDQGYLIVACYFSGLVKTGSILEQVSAGHGYKAVHGPMVIVGPATRDEWEAQNARYNKFQVQRPARAVELWKVVAE